MLIQVTQETIEIMNRAGFYLVAAMAIGLTVYGRFERARKFSEN